MIPSRFIESGSNAFAQYWNFNQTNYLTRFLPQNISLADAKDYVHYLLKSDDLGDAIAEEYLLRYGFQDGMEKLLCDLKKPLSVLASANFKAFYNQVLEVPNWVNFDLINVGVCLSNRGGTASLSVLRNYSLMGGYESAAINKPLVLTGALKKGSVFRLASTIDFWLNVTSKNELMFYRKGWESCIRTRMVHSFSRIMIIKTGKWKTENWGVPLNQWDMLATNLGFSIIFLDGLNKLGVKASKIEEDGTIMLWRYVSYLLGIDMKLIPENLEDSAKSFYYWSKTQPESDADSKALAQSLYEEPQFVSFEKSRKKKKFIQQLNLSYCYYFLQNEGFDKLALPKKIGKMRILKFTIFINKLLGGLSKINYSMKNKIAQKGWLIQDDIRKKYMSELKK